MLNLQMRKVLRRHPGQHPARKELKEEREYPWGNGDAEESQAGIRGWGVLPPGLGSAWGTRLASGNCHCTFYTS